MQPSHVPMRKLRLATPCRSQVAVLPPRAFYNLHSFHSICDHVCFCRTIDWLLSSLSSQSWVSVCFCKTIDWWFSSLSSQSWSLQCLHHIQSSTQPVLCQARCWALKWSLIPVLKPQTLPDAQPGVLSSCEGAAGALPQGLLFCLRNHRSGVLRPAAWQHPLGGRGLGRLGGNLWKWWVR